MKKAPYQTVEDPLRTERSLVFRGRSRSYLEGIFIPSNFSGAPPRAGASTNEDGGRVVASVARRLRP